MVLGSTQPLTNTSTRNISWRGKGSWCIGLTTLLPSCADCFEIWQLQPLGTLRACTGIVLRLLFPFALVLGDGVYRQGPLKSNNVYAPEPSGGFGEGGVKCGVKGRLYFRICFHILYLRFICTVSSGPESIFVYDPEMS